MKKLSISMILAGALLLAGANAWANEVLIDNSVVIGKGCIGLSCVPLEAFGSETIKLRDTDPAVRIDDTSGGIASSNDWQLTFNPGASNQFSIDDITGNRTPFTIEAGAPNHSLFVDDAGRVGLGTSTPTDPLHLKASAGGATPRMMFENPDAVGGNQKWFFDVKDSNGDFRISRFQSGQQEFKLTPSGDLTIPGDFISGGTTLNVPDYVFEPGYHLLPLDELSDFIEREKHLPNVPSAEEIHKDGINMTAFQMKLLEKVEELTLYAVAQEQTIRELKERLEDIELAKN